MRLYAKGSEAHLFLEDFFKLKTLVKIRNKKSYMDEKLRKWVNTKRTLREVKLLHKAKKAGVLTPFVLEVGDNWFRMQFIEGKKAPLSKNTAVFIGKNLALLHYHNIIHGDLTPNNVIATKDEWFVIDFGLGFFSNRIEDKADDLLVSIYALKQWKNVLIGAYVEEGGKEEVISRVNDILGRVRYAKG